MTKRRFVVTEDHIKLLRRMWVGWSYCEFGAPEIDPKRPYGNSWVYGDIAEIIGISPCEGDKDNPDFSDEQKGRMDLLHKETMTALQIFLAVGVMTPGTYEAEEYYENWRKV